MINRYKNRLYKLQTNIQRRKKFQVKLKQTYYSFFRLVMIGMYYKMKIVKKFKVDKSANLPEMTFCCRGFFIMVTDLPKYMRDVLQFEVFEVGLYSSLPYIAMWIVSVTSGILCDYLIVNGIMTITFARKLFTAIGEHLIKFQYLFLLATYFSNFIENETNFIF